jgi:hypothetical protein
MRKCIRCGLLSPDESIRCQCGFLFNLDDPGAVTREHERWRASARTQLLGGLALAAFGGAVTVLTYVNASARGGTYVIWTGALACGVGLAIRAMLRLRAIGQAEKPLE